LGADEEELKINSERAESRKLCGQTTVVTVREGSLKYPGSPEKATVIYRTNVNFGGNQYVVNLLSNAQDIKEATQKATNVFNSLQCLRQERNYNSVIDR